MVSNIWIQGLRSYLSSSNKFEEEASNSWTKQLSNPVEESSDDGDVASHGQSEGDSWIQVATWDVGCHGHSHK